MKINNATEWAKKKSFIVYRVVDNEAWFYDAWDKMPDAINQALEVGGAVIRTAEATF